MRTFFAVLGGIVLVALVCVGGWQLYWVLHGSAVSREASIGRHSFEYQQTRREELTKEIRDVRDVDVQLSSASGDTAVALRAQRRAMVNDACDVAAKIDGDLPRGTSQFVLNECGG